MKFLCDRCKTRYSIGDERVRGKILKIRCKNCANVITVREGMSDADAPAAAAPDAYKRPKIQTEAAGIEQVVAATPAPAASANGRNGSSGALNAAFANAMSKPPPALEEEWYVSIDGDQSGPFTLAEAQRWVAGKAFDAELHCWSEGFDDWLPVDKVSHFRGLRKKPPPPAAPPPLPRVGSGPVRQQPWQGARAVEAVEEEPKPLFAATMASLEKAAAPAAQPAPRALNLPSVTRPSATPPGGQPVYKNGNGAKESSAPIAAKGTGAATSTGPAGSIRPTTAPGMGSAKPYRFDAPSESATQLEALPFDDEQRTTAEPVAAAARKLAPATSTPSNAVTANHNAYQAGKSTSPTPAFKPVHTPAPPPPAADDADDDDIDIGEVSRVVKLADLVKPQPKPAAKRSGPIATGGSNPMLARTGSVPKLSVPVPLAQAVEGGALDSSAPIGVPSEVPGAISPAVVAVHRRGVMALLVGAAALIGIAILLIILVVNKDDDVTSLGGQYDIDTQRPDQVVRRPGDPPVTGPEQVNPYLPPKKPWVPQRPPPVKPPDQPPPGNSLKADEIESMAAKYSGTTTSCWRRAQRGANGILLADVKKITITMSIAPDGTVTNVALSDGHAGNDLGKCLIGAMRGWKFRTSAGGDFRFVLHFG